MIFFTLVSRRWRYLMSFQYYEHLAFHLRLLLEANFHFLHY